MAGLSQEEIDNTLGSLQRTPSPTSGLNTDNVNQGYDFNMTPEMQNAYDQYQQANTPASEVLPIHQYYPTLGGQVAVGNYSGNQIGSTTLFAPDAGVVPLGMFAARDNAIRAAALKKQQDVDNFLKSFKAPTSKLVNINDQLREEYFNHLEKGWNGALKAAGGDPNKAAYLLRNNVQFHQKEKSFHDLANFGNDIVNKTAQDEEDIKSGKFVPTPAYNELKTKLYTALDPSHPEFQNLGNTYRRMGLEREFSGIANQYIDKAVQQQLSSAGVDNTNPDYLATYETTKKGFTPEALQQIAGDIKNQIYPTSDYWTLPRIQASIQQMYGSQQVKKNVTASQKREPGGADVQYTDQDIAKEPSSNNVFVNTGTSGVDAEGNPIISTRKGNVVGEFGVQHKQPIKTIIPNGQNIYINDANNGLVKTSEVNPNSDVQLFKTQLVKTLNVPAGTKGSEHNGTPLDEEQIKAGIPFKWTPMTSGVITEGTGQDKTEKQFFVPTTQVENVLVKKRGPNGEVQRGIPVDKLYNEANVRNANLSVPAKQTQQIPSTKGSKIEDLRKKYNY